MKLQKKRWFKIHVTLKVRCTDIQILETVL